MQLLGGWGSRRDKKYRASGRGARHQGGAGRLIPLRAASLAPAQCAEIVAGRSVALGEREGQKRAQAAQNRKETFEGGRHPGEATRARGAPAPTPGHATPHSVTLHPSQGAGFHACGGYRLRHSAFVGQRVDDDVHGLLNRLDKVDRLLHSRLDDHELAHPGGQAVLDTHHLAAGLRVV